MIAENLAEKCLRGIIQNLWCLMTKKTALHSNEVKKMSDILHSKAINLAIAKEYFYECIAFF